MEKTNITIFKIGFLLLGVLAAIGLIGYGLSYIVVMPSVRPDGFVPIALDHRSTTPPGFGTILAAFVLLFAFSFLPVVTLFTVKKYPRDPYAMIFAGCLAGTASLIEIFNSLPLVARGVYPGRLASIPAEVLLYLQQTEAIRFLAFDIAGFTLIYAASLMYAIIFFRTQRYLSGTIFASIGLFLANVPCLWFAPYVAVLLMSSSIFALAPVPIRMAQMIVRE